MKEEKVKKNPKVSSNSSERRRSHQYVTRESLELAKLQAHFNPVGVRVLSEIEAGANKQEAKPTPVDYVERLQALSELAPQMERWLVCTLMPDIAASTTLQGFAQIGPTIIENPHSAGLSTCIEMWCSTFSLELVTVKLQQLCGVAELSGGQTKDGGVPGLFARKIAQGMAPNAVWVFEDLDQLPEHQQNQYADLLKDLASPIKSRRFPDAGLPGLEMNLQSLSIILTVKDSNKLPVDMSTHFSTVSIPKMTVHQNMSQIERLFSLLLKSHGVSAQMLPDLTREACLAITALPLPRQQQILKRALGAAIYLREHAIDERHVNDVMSYEKNGILPSEPTAQKFSHSFPF